MVISIADGDLLPFNAATKGLYAAKLTIKRERKVDPTIMFWVLVMSFGVRLERCLASIKRSYEKSSDKKLAPV